MGHRRQYAASVKRLRKKDCFSTSSERPGSPYRLSNEQTRVFGPMPDRWEHTTDNYSFRFFSPEQVDQILRDGIRRGRQGSHTAIERILKHEPGLQRADLWQRIRRLKNPARQRPHFRSVWSTEDEKTLREGYQAGWQEKREVVCQLLQRHPDWRPHVIWKHATKLGLVQRTSKRGQERSCKAWSKEDDRILLDLAGYKTARVIAKMLHRSEAAVRYRLTLLGKSSRVHLEGFARSALARELHLSTNAIQRLIVEGLLEVRDPRITRESLDRLCRSGRLEAIRQNGVQRAPHVAQRSDREMTMPAANGSTARNSTECTVTSGKPSRAKRVWAEVAGSLSVSSTSKPLSTDAGFQSASETPTTSPCAWPSPWATGCWCATTWRFTETSRPLQCAVMRPTRRSRRADYAGAGLS